MYNAFYYEDKYYLIPNEFSDYQGFMEALHNGQCPSQIQTVALLEDHNICNYSAVKGRSIAPYFLSGYNDALGTVTIKNTEDVYPVQVEIYSQTEYNAKLREKILEVCPGCLRYKPLSNRVQSLNGHFEEMGLDGVCLFRQETKPSPRNFHDHLFSFGGFYMRFHYFTRSASEMLDMLRERFYVRYAGGELYDFGERKELILTSRKNELLLPVLTDAISNYLSSITNEAYCIRLMDPIPDIRAWIDYALSVQQKDAFEKDCKKYGVSIGILEYMPEAAEKIRRSLKPLLDHFWIFPLLQEDGKEYYLFADSTYVLKELRYRAPLLQAYGAQVDVCGQYGNMRYTVSFEMPHCGKQ